MQYQGSEWQKWDLHLHTIYSHSNSQYNCTMKEVAAKILSEGIKVVGVTNYFIVQENEITELAEEVGNQVYIIPNFEFRINEKNKANEYINIHILFNPDTTTMSQIYSSLARVELTNIASEVKVYCTLENIKTIGVEKITVAFKDLIDQLSKDLRPTADFLVVGVNKGYGGFCPGGKPRDKELATKIDTLSDFIFSRKEDRDFYLNKIDGREELNLPIKAVVECSDAHRIGDIGTKYSWIKADATFEGLKQVIYEPAHRIIISEQKPIPPPRKIEALKISFPTDTLIGRREDKGSINKFSTFCLRNNRELRFSPHFTCLIGGRGAGKSTILNIIAKNIGHKNNFFDTNVLRSYQNTETLKDLQEFEKYTEIEGIKEVEYISQNEVEDFAKDKEKLTSAIYSRLIQNSNSEIVFRKAEEKIEQNITEITKQVRDVNLIHQKRIELVTANKLLLDDEKIVNSFNNPNYTSLKEKINTIGTQIERLNIAKHKYVDLIAKITDLSEKYEFSNEILNSIETEIDIVVKKLKAIIVAKFNFTAAENEIAILYKQQQDVSALLEDFLRTQGLSQENINDYERATKAIPQYATTIQNLNTEIKEIESNIKLFESNSILFFQDKESLENLVNDKLTPFNDKLKSKNSNVKDISFKYNFDNEKAKDALFTEFWNYFESKHPSKYGLKTQRDAVERYLYFNEPEKVLTLSRANFLKKYEQQPKRNEDVQANTYLLKLFEEDVNFDIYKLLVLRTFIDPLKYKEITGYYDSKELKSCSFGQRCTAVIVALLTFGNKPLIIDEPEAHLDSKLIAEYLVDLIKDTKQGRQIIFATHNANFVINGDAELILHLEIDDNNETKITPISIENIKQRDKLLLLEGGEEAFKKRDKRLIKK